jgi:molecular chaperone GrpE (heat shock protein)
LLFLLSARDENLAHTIMVKMTELMSTYGMVEIATKPGDTFDPTMHDDRGIEQTESEYPRGTIAQTVRKGYKIKKADRDVVIRPVWVQLSRGQHKEASDN